MRQAWAPTLCHCAERARRRTMVAIALCCVVDVEKKFA